MEKDEQIEKAEVKSREVELLEELVCEAKKSSHNTRVSMFMTLALSIMAMAIALIAIIKAIQLSDLSLFNKTTDIVVVLASISLLFYLIFKKMDKEF